MSSILVILLTSTVELQNWTEPKLVLETDEEQYNPIVFFENNSKHLFWVTVDSSDKYHINYFQNNTIELIWDATEPIEDLKVIKDENKFHLIWTQGSGFFGNIYYTSGSQNNWDIAIMVSGSEYAYSPSIAIDGLNIVHIVWSERTQLEQSYFVNQIYYRNFSVEEEIWSETWWLTEDMVDAHHIDENYAPVIKIDNWGNIFFG